MKKLYLLLFLLLTIHTTGAADVGWLDVTTRFVQNADFNSGNSNGWTINSSAGQKAVSANVMRFWNGTFDFSQRLANLPMGRYRLSVQGFFRYEGDSFQAYKNGTERQTAFLYAGETTTPLVSVYSESMTSTVGNRQEHDGHFYPDNSTSAAAAFAEGLYRNNSIEFDAQGGITIGVRCQEAGTNNYCAFDNFKLEYLTDVVKITSIAVSLPTTELVIGETITAQVNIQPETATLPFVDWTTSNPQVAVVDQNGTITAVGMGTATVTAAANDGSDVKGSVTVSVGNNPATVGSLIINEIMVSNVDEYISPAFNFDGWVELYNPTGRAVQLAGVKVSDGTGTWTMPSSAGVIPARGYHVVWFDSNDGNPQNVPFKLDTDGGTVVFSNIDGQELDRLDYPASLERISYARSTDGAGDWGMTGTPTLGASNNGISFANEQIEDPIVNQPSQLFTGSLDVEVAIPSGCTLRYTTDGKLPTLQYGETSMIGRFTVSNTQCFRFRLFAEGKLPSRVTTRAYIYKDKNYYLPVVSVVSDRDFLYSSEIGVMAKGPNGRPGRGQDDNCNWNMDWERPVNFSYLTADGKMVLNQDVNLEMCGGWSRAYSPHSFKLKGEKEMGGDKNLLYPFFEQKPYIRNRTLQIRNGGNEHNSGRLKDGALQFIIGTSGIDVDYQSYQPVHEFINGKYIGLLNVREPNNKHYVYANYGWDDDEIDQFEMSADSGYVQICGTPDAFNELVDVLSPDAANSQTYEEICRVLDIDEYINYMAAQMYLGGTDFPQNNVKGFRHRDGGRFRFVLFDLDFAFYTSSPFTTFFAKENYTFDPLKPASLGRIHDRIRFVTLFKNMLQNADFRRRFIDAYCIMGGSVYEKSRSAAIFDELLNRVEPAMRLEGQSASSSAQNLKDNLNGRLSTAISALKNYSTFKLSSTSAQQVTLSSSTEGARLFINDEVIPTGSFKGQLFRPVTLRAEAPAGYVFDEWTDGSGKTYDARSKISLPSGTVNLKATFRKLSAAESKKQGITPVRINEISGANDSYIDEYGKKGDWVELYNTTSEAIDVEGMYLTDNINKPTKYQITKGDTKANTIIPAHGYLVVWCDNKRATTDNGLHASFKIADDGGLLMLSAADQSWTDVMSYDAHDARTTVGRYPDGTANVYAMNVATIGKSNIYSSYATAVAQSDIPSGLETITASGDLRVVYASGLLLVKNSGGGTANVEVFRADGVSVRQTSFDMQNGTARISVADLPTGFYVARVSDGNGGKSSCRFVK